MTPYRLTGAPLVEMGPAFLGQFALNLETPEQGPYVPHLAFDPERNAGGFEQRPFRSHPEAFINLFSSLTRRLPTNVYHDHLLAAGDPSAGRLPWFAIRSRHDADGAFSVFLGQKEKGRKGKPHGSSVDVFYYR